MKRKTKSKAWFTPVRGSYLPRSWQGISIYLVYLIYEVALLVAWNIRGHHLWQLLTIVVPLALTAASVAQYVASKHAK